MGAPVYWSLTYQGEHTANVFREESKAQETLDRLNKVYPGKEDARAIVPLYTGAPTEETIVAAAQAVVRQALDDVSVHPCDYHDDAVRARLLHGPVSDLHAALTARGTK